LALDAPFPYFGGKVAVADLVWNALGAAEVAHYIEPFFGSGAVLLARPGYDPARHTETINDKDGFVCNVWRALQGDPDAVARWCDWPVNHADLMARRRALLGNEARLLENLVADDTWYDAKLAGYWIWAASCWIGSGLTRLGARPNVSDGGKGVHKLGKRPHLSHRGKGIHKLGQRPHTSGGGSEGPEPLEVRDPYNTNLYAWFRALAERLRYVRVVCGDWTRVCGGNWQDTLGLCGIFLDPPYGATDRDQDLYHHESQDVARQAAEWALARGGLPTHRIVLAGYYEEHARLLDYGWRVHRWTAHGGYSAVAGKQEGRTRGQGNQSSRKSVSAFQSLNSGPPGPCPARP